MTVEEIREDNKKAIKIMRAHGVDIHFNSDGDYEFSLPKYYYDIFPVSKKYNVCNHDGPIAHAFSISYFIATINVMRVLTKQADDAFSSGIDGDTMMTLKSDFFNEMEALEQIWEDQKAIQKELIDAGCISEDPLC